MVIPKDILKEYDVVSYEDGSLIVKNKVSKDKTNNTEETQNEDRKDQPDDNLNG